MSIQQLINTRALVAACTLSAAGALVFNAFPLFLGNIAGQYGFNDEQLGLLGTAYLGGFALIALFAPLWMPRLPWRLAGALAYAVILASVLMLHTVPAEQIHIAMGLLGCGSGVIFTLALGVLSAAKNPDRAYGWMLVAQMALAGVLMWVMTALIIDAFGYLGFILVLLAFYGASTLALVALPKNFMSSAEQADQEAGSDGLNRTALIATVALFFQFGTFSGLWGFMERIGEINGVHSETVGTVLTLSLVAGLAGAFLCVLMGQRFGHRKPILAAMTLTLAAVALLYQVPGTVSFVIAACFLNALLQFLAATQMALVTEVDHSGRYTVMIAFILAAGGAIGPGVLGTIVESLGLPFGYLWALFFTLVAMALTWLATAENTASDAPLARASA